MARRIVIPAIDLVNPSVDLERLKDGRANWTLKFKQPAQSGRWTLDLHEIAFAQGNLGYYDQQKQFDLSAVIDTLGQPIPFGAVMKQQEALAHHESAKAVGPAGQKKLAAQAHAGSAQPVVPASGAEAASRASAAASQALAAASHAAATTSGSAIAPAASGTAAVSNAPATAAPGRRPRRHRIIGGLGARGHHRRRHLHDRLDRQGDLQEGQGRRHGQDRQFAGRAGRATSVSGSGRFALWRYAPGARRHADGPVSPGRDRSPAVACGHQHGQAV